MKELHFDIDFTVWLLGLPAQPVPEFDLTDEEWAVQMARFAWTGTRAGKRELEHTRRLLLLCGGRDYPSPESKWAVKFLHLPDPAGVPVPAMVAYLPPDGDRDAALRTLVRDGDPSCVEPPIVDTVETSAGTAYRGLAYHLTPDADGKEMLLATLSYAWRVENPDQWDDVMDVRLWAAGTPDQIIAMAADLERLAGSLSWTEPTTDDDA